MRYIRRLVSRSESDEDNTDPENPRVDEFELYPLHPRFDPMTKKLRINLAYLNELANQKGDMDRYVSNRLRALRKKLGKKRLDRSTESQKSCSNKEIDKIIKIRGAIGIS